MSTTRIPITPFPASLANESRGGFALAGVDGADGVIGVTGVDAVLESLFSFMMTESLMPAGVEMRFWAGRSSSSPDPALVHFRGSKRFAIAGARDSLSLS